MPDRTSLQSVWLLGRFKMRSLNRAYKIKYARRQNESMTFIIQCLRVEHTYQQLLASHFKVFARFRLTMVGPSTRFLRFRLRRILHQSIVRPPASTFSSTHAVVSYRLADTSECYCPQSPKTYLLNILIREMQVPTGG